MGGVCVRCKALRNGWCVRAVQSIKEWVVCACGAER